MAKKQNTARAKGAKKAHNWHADPVHIQTRKEANVKAEAARQAAAAWKTATRKAAEKAARLIRREQARQAKAEQQQARFDHTTLLSKEISHLIVHKSCA